jgi:hypothetical protein
VVNKKLLFGVSMTVVVAILVLLALLRLTPLGENRIVGLVIALLLTIFALPMRLYVIFVLGENSSWPLPLLILFLALSGLMWGIIVERVAYLLSKKRTAS